MSEAESERVPRIARVASEAERVFGDATKAGRWLSRCRCFESASRSASLRLWFLRYQNRFNNLRRCLRVPPLNPASSHASEPRICRSISVP